MIRKSVSISGRQTVYWEHNPERAQTIIMLHGFRGNHKGLRDLIRYFDDYRLIVPDLPGYGESEPLGVAHTLVHYAKWLDEFAVQVAPKDWISWSHSYSGSIALIQAAEGLHRPGRVVTVSLAAVRRGPASAVSTLYYRVGELLPAKWQQKWIASRTVDHATGRWLFMTASTHRRKELQRIAERDLPFLNAKVVTEEYMSALETDLDGYACRADVPVLVIAGARDVIVPLDRLRRLTELMPDGKLWVMDDQGHLAPVERPGACASLTKRFLRGERAPEADDDSELARVS